jgi:hypothetical protein
MNLNERFWGWDWTRENEDGRSKGFVKCEMEDEEEDGRTKVWEIAGKFWKKRAKCEWNGF